MTVKGGGQTATVTGNVTETYKNDQSTTITGTLTIKAKTINITSADGVSVQTPSWKDNCHGWKWVATGANFAFYGSNLALTGASLKHTMLDISHNPLAISKTNFKLSNDPMTFTQLGALVTNGALRLSTKALAIFL